MRRDHKRARNYIANEGYKSIIFQSLCEKVDRHQGGKGQKTVHPNLLRKGYMKRGNRQNQSTMQTIFNPEQQFPYPVNHENR